MTGPVVTTTVDAFVRTLAGWGADVPVAVHGVVVAVATVAAEHVVDGGPYSPGTPTRSGWHRGSWVAGLDGPAAGPRDPETEPVVADPLSAIRAVLAGSQPGQAPYLTSDGPAMVALEEGASDQAPTGFVRLLLTAAQEITDAAVARERARWGWAP